ncbi:MAG: hypothetical protein EU529_02495 [Promethearchaeota archaeon]|nr:MAG: hypothetical protein EU529_02495 [Candidatus Lokiarchaeota archaeon]
MTTNRNKKIRLAKILVLILIFSNLIIPLISIESNNHSYNNNLSESSIPKPKTQAFSKDLYNPTRILEEEKYGLGSINITLLKLEDIGPGFYSTNDVEYSNYKQDLTSKALNMSFKHIKFIKTSKIAQVDNRNESIEDFRKITVKLNETLSIQFNNTNTDYLIYASKLTPCVIDQLLVENNTESIKKVNDGNYSLIKPPETEINFLKFNYKNYFKLNTLNFTMHIIWRYNLTIDPWQLTQDISQELIITDEDNIVYPRFNYNFDIIGYKYNLTKDGFKKIPADDLLINLTIDLPDKNLLSSHRLSINGIRITTDFLHPDKSVYTKDLIRANESSIAIDFTTSFTLDFVDPVDYTWGIDRLVEDKDIRERIYFPEIISGPKHIFLKHVKILEETISFDQVITSTSLFKRIVLYKEINISELEEDIRNSLIFHEYATKRQGIKITLPYIIKGETCPFIIRYETTNDLRIIITDNINMPLSDLEVVLYYYDEIFGTYISKDKSQPLGPLITDENGEVLIEDVPNGNYTAKIYRRDSDDLIKKAEVSAFLDINYIVTQIIHFPLLILIFGGIGGLFFILGLIFYLKREDK